MANPKDNPVSANQTPLNQGCGDPNFDRVGPLLTAQKLRKQYLFGIPLKSTLTGDELSNADLKDFINDAVSKFETTIRIPVLPTKVEDKFDFQRADDLQHGTRQLTRFPIIKIENLAALFPGRAEGQETDYPTSWVSPLSDTGLIRIVPNSGTLVNADVSFVASVGYKAILLGGIKQWPNVWRIRYWAGFERGKIPHIVNRLIGIYAAQNVLSQLGPVVFPIQSYGIGIDGLSQSTGTAGNQWLAQRIADLDKEQAALEQTLKAHYSVDLYFGAW